MQNTLADGLVIENLPNATFRVRLTASGQELLCYLAGRMKMRWARLLPGDKVQVETSPYDATRGRIVARFR